MNDKKRHLKNAPIVEAVIDVRFDAGQSDIAADSIRAFASKHFGEKFCDIEDTHEVKAEIALNKDSAATSHVRRFTGVRATSDQLPEVLQVRANGFVFSRLTPYQSWSLLKKSAAEVLSAYVDHFAPVGLDRIGLRFINRMDFDAEGFDIRSVFTSCPCAVPNNEAYRPNRFLTRAEFSTGTPEVGALVTKALEPTNAGIAVILDIDVFRDYSGESFENIWDDFELLRTEKNTIFFSSLTEGTLRGFE